MQIRVVALVALAVLLCGCAATSSLRDNSAAAQPTPIPWISATPASLLLPTPTPTPIPPGTRVCRAADLNLVFGGIGTLTGGQLSAGIIYGNRTATACVLQGLIGVKLFDARGRQIALTTAPADGMSANPILVQPGTADVQAHTPMAGVAYTELHWDTHDGAGNPCVPAPPQGTSLAVTVPGDQASVRVVVGNDPLDRWSAIIPCYSRIAVSAFQAWPAPEVVPTPDPYAALAISLDVPATIKAGSLLRYTVSLRNATTDPINFPDPCPVYGEWAANTSAAFAKNLYLLNCGPVRAIQPGQAVRFAMEMAVPSGTEAGRYTLAWNFAYPGALPGPPGTATVTVTR